MNTYLRSREIGNKCGNNKSAAFLLRVGPVEIKRDIFRKHGLQKGPIRAFYLRLTKAHTTFSTLAIHGA